MTDGESGADEENELASVKETFKRLAERVAKMTIDRVSGTISAAEHHCHLASTKLYCFVTEAHAC